MTGLLAGFSSEEALNRAAARMVAEKLENIETYTSTPLDAESEPTGSPLPLVMFIAGMLGFIGFMCLMAYADIRAYPLDIGGRPKFSWPAFIPIAFELGVLCAMSAGFLGFFWICRMPTLYDPVDQCDALLSASREGWLLAVRSLDADRLKEARSLLAGLDPKSLEEFSE